MNHQTDDSQEQSDGPHNAQEEQRLTTTRRRLLRQAALAAPAMLTLRTGPAYATYESCDEDGNCTFVYGNQATINANQIQQIDFLGNNRRNPNPESYV